MGRMPKFTLSKDEEVKLPPGIDLVPSSKQLVELEEWMRRRDNKWRIHQDLLLGPIEQLRGSYDFIFFDTPPQVTTTTLPAMKAADFVILSCMPEKASTERLWPSRWELQFQTELVQCSLPFG